MNTINSCPSSFAQADTTYNMEDSNSPTFPRQRKRKNDDTNLSEEDKLKKKKNRDAAKKCREKKEKEAKQLKERNNELEKENEELAKVKIKLEERITNIKTIISEHMNKGCKLPPHVQEIWDQEFGSASRLSDMKDFIEVGTMEIQNSRMHTPPHTPDSSSSGRLSPSSSVTFTESSAPTPMPVSLFSGAPIQQQNVRRKNSSTSRSPSASPGPASYTGALKEDSAVQMQDLSQHLLAAKLIHPALAPIQVTPSNHFRISSTVSTDRLSISENYSQVQTVPTVVLDDDSEEGSEEGLEFKEDESYTLQTNGKLVWIPVPEDPMSKAFEHPDVPSEDVISNELFRSKEYYKSDHNPTENENLSSLGFNAPEGYSFAEDLEEPEPVQNIIEYATSSVPSVNANNDRLSKTSTQISSDVSIATCAPALLSLGTNISPTLQAQIKSYSKPNTSPAIPLLVMHRAQNQQNLLTDHGQQFTIQLVSSNPSQQNNMISTTSKYTSNTSVPASPTLQMAQVLQQGQHATLTVVSPEFVKGLSFQVQDQSAVSKDISQHRNIPTCVSNNIMPMINKQQRPQQNISVPQVLLSSSQLALVTSQANQAAVSRMQAGVPNPVAITQANQAAVSRMQAGVPNPVAITQANQAAVSRMQAGVQNPVATSKANQATLSRMQAAVENPTATSQANQATMGRMQAAVQNLPSGDFSSAVNDLPSLNFNEMDQENIFEKTRATKVSSS